MNSATKFSDENGMVEAYYLLPGDLIPSKPHTAAEITTIARTTSTGTVIVHLADGEFQILDEHDKVLLIMRND